MSESLEQWIAKQYEHAAVSMRMSISPTSLVKHRPGFAQSIHPKQGSVVASPVPASYDPDPDYFFHWYRDSAVVMDSLRLLAAEPQVRTRALGDFADFVNFSLSLRSLDGRDFIAEPAWRSKIAPDFVKFLRTEEDLAAARGPQIAAETRVNADGTLDISSWPRPQNDGPPMRALTLLRWSRDFIFDAPLRSALGALLRADLEFTRCRWRDACFDIWEEDKGLHYYTLRIAAAALEQGSAWLEEQGHREDAKASRAAAGEALIKLDEFWISDEGYYRSRFLESGTRSAKELDISVILAAIHAGATSGRHSPQDERMQATLARLEALFDADYAINRGRPAGRAPALGRYAGDVYYSGGAYFFSTLGAAEFCFRAAAVCADTQGLVGRGDEYLQTVRAYTAANGDLSEQFDQNSGEQSSAKHLAWSYAAFISCIAARRAAILRGPAGIL